jgi:hypothetical protein
MLCKVRLEAGDAIIEFGRGTFRRVFEILVVTLPSSDVLDAMHRSLPGGNVVSTYLRSMPSLIYISHLQWYRKRPHQC